MTKKIILGCMAIAAFAAFVIPATASASPRICETVVFEGTCTNVSVGTLIKGHNVGDWTFTTSAGNIVCSTVDETGSLTENSGTSIKLDITSASFSGTGTEGDCTGPLNTSAKVINNEGNGLPWCITANSEMNPDEFQTRGNSCNNASRSITFKISFTGLVHCWYNRTLALVGTLTTDVGSGEDAILILAEQEWALEKEERTSIFASACPPSGKLDGKETLETDSSATEPLYIK